MTAGRSADPWFSIPMPNPAARLRLFCVPYAGGGASAYFAWSRALASAPIEVRAVQPPGRENRLREAPHRDLRSLVQALFVAMRPHLDRPYAIFGHSMGALVAYELTREIARHGAPLPVRVFVSGARAPEIPSDDEPLHPIGDDETFVREVARRYGGVPQLVLENAELRSVVVPALRADLTVTESYRFEPATPLPVDFVAFGGTRDDRVSEEKLTRWRDRTSATFSSRMFDGDHFFVNDARDAVIAAVTAHLDPHL